MNRLRIVAFIAATALIAAACVDEAEEPATSPAATDAVVVETEAPVATPVAPETPDVAGETAASPDPDPAVTPDPEA